MTTIAARPRIVGYDLTVEGSEEVFRGKIVDVAQVRSPSRLFTRTYHVFTIDGTRADGGDEIASVLMFDDTTPIRSLLLAFPDLMSGFNLSWRDWPSSSPKTIAQLTYLTAEDRIRDVCLLATVEITAKAIRTKQGRIVSVYSWAHK